MNAPMRRIRSFEWVCSLMLLTVLACSHAKKKEAEVPVTPESNTELLEKICSLGNKTKRVSGSLWMKTVAEGKSAQFPATVQATAPDQVQMEVTNALGGTEAWIEVKGGHFDVKLPEGKGQGVSGKDHWKGIPLRWAPALFLAQIPCPETKLRVGAKITREKDNQLSVIAGVDRFLYEGDFSGAVPEIKSLRWEKGGKSVNFSWPGGYRWEAKSPLGEVKIRWNERDVEEKK